MGATPGRASGHAHQRTHPPRPWWRRWGRWLIALGPLIVAPVLVTVLGDTLSEVLRTRPEPAAPALHATARLDEEAAGRVALRAPVTDQRERAAMLLGEIGLSRLRATHDGARVGRLDVELTLQGQADPVTVNMITIKRRNRFAEAPLHGTVIEIPSAGEQDKILLKADLDRRSPAFTGARGGAYFVDRAITLRPGEQVPVRMVFSARRYHHEFDLVLTYTRAGRQETTTIRGPDAGHFRVTGPADEYGEIFRLNGGAFRRVTPSPCPEGC